MKKIISEILFGLVIIIAVLLLELLVMMPFGSKDDGQMNLEFLLTALPAGLVTFFSAMLLKTAGQKEALRKGLIWCGMLFIFYLSIGLANDTATGIFSAIGFYVMLLLALIGPMIYWRFIKRHRGARPTI